MKFDLDSYMFMCKRSCLSLETLATITLVLIKLQYTHFDVTSQGQFQLTTVVLLEPFWSNRCPVPEHNSGVMSH